MKMEAYKSRNKTHRNDISTLVRRPMCPRKTICRHVKTNMRKLSTSSVAFSTCSCQEDYVKSENTWVQSALKVTPSYYYLVYLYLILLCSSITVVIAASDDPESLEYSDSIVRVTSNIPHRTKAETFKQPLDDINAQDQSRKGASNIPTLPRVRHPRRPLQIIDHPVADIRRREQEYIWLYSDTADKDGLESIRALHRQLDDDNDGSIEPSETGDFIRGDLKKDVHGADRRQIKFHRKDSEITVNDLWDIWKKSDIHNWTVDQTIEWLSGSHVELPQYADLFRRHGVNGSRLPQVAVSTGYLAKVVGVTNAIHRSKITLKAMDVVLFGPPKSDSSPIKDLILTSLLLAAITGLFYAYRQNRKSQLHLKKMMQDMEGLSKAEESLLELQDKLHDRDTELKSLSQGSKFNYGAASDGIRDFNGEEDTPLIESERMELDRVKEEVEALRNELHRAEVELEDKCWMAPPVLQHWLQLTYELESITYNNKKREAEKQLETVKDMCEKLKKKQKSLMGAFVSTHGRSIDDVDRSILEARTALIEVTKDLSERSQRWRQIEVLCGVSIVSNPGISALQNLVRTVGAGRLPTAATPSLSGSNAGDSLIGGLRNRPLSSRMSNRGSQDDLLQDDDAHSVAASSYMTSASQRRHVMGSDLIGSSAASISGSTTMHHRTPSSVIVSRSGAGNKSVISKQMSRESSKESGVSGSSGSSDDLVHQMSGNAGGGKKTTTSTSVLH